MNETNNKDWNQPGTWAEELVEQAKQQAYRYHVMFKICVGIIVLLIVALVATNAYWIHTFSSYEYIEQFSDGINSINTGTQGDIINESGGEN